MQSVLLILVLLVQAVHGQYQSPFRSLEHQQRSRQPAYPEPLKIIDAPVHVRVSSCQVPERTLHEGMRLTAPTTCSTPGNYLGEPFRTLLWCTMRKANNTSSCLQVMSVSLSCIPVNTTVPEAEILCSLHSTVLLFPLADGPIHPSRQCTGQRKRHRQLLQPLGSRYHPHRRQVPRLLLCLALRHARLDYRACHFLLGRRELLPRPGRPIQYKERQCV